MARINIEEEWWSDSRRQKLVRLFKGDARLADGLMIQAWRLAQKYSDRKFLIPITEFLCLEDSEYLFECCLADICVPGTDLPRQIQANPKQCLDLLGKMSPSAMQYLVYLRGSEKYLDWISVQRAKASVGGKKSAQRPRDSRGRLLPKVQAEPKQCLVNSPSEPNTPQRSSSSSSSSSSSFSKKEEYIGESPHVELAHKGFDFEAIYELYPKRLGQQQKGKGIESLQKTIKTEAQFDELMKAVENYASHIRSVKKERTEFVKQFFFFVNPKFWREWISPETSGAASIQWDEMNWGDSHDASSLSERN